MYMQRVSEFGGQGSVAGVDTNSILSSLRGLTRSKYGDIILLCTVIRSLLYASGVLGIGLMQQSR